MPRPWALQTLTLPHPTPPSHPPPLMPRALLPLALQPCYAQSPTPQTLQLHHAQTQGPADPWHRHIPPLQAMHTPMPRALLSPALQCP